MEKARALEEALEDMDGQEGNVDFYDVCNNGGKPKKRTFATDQVQYKVSDIKYNDQRGRDIGLC